VLCPTLQPRRTARSVILSIYSQLTANRRAAFRFEIRQEGAVAERSTYVRLRALELTAFSTVSMPLLSALSTRGTSAGKERQRHVRRRDRA
jgi:hypothetical protein